MAEPVTATIPARVYRVARRTGLLRFSMISPEDAALATAGNRFDVAGGGVLYCGTDEESCFAETMARLRPTPVMRELLKEQERGFMAVGGVPQDWRLQRVVGTLHAPTALPFLDVEAPETHTYLSEQLSTQLVALGYTDNLDFADLCNRDRRLSRAVSELAYTATDDDGSFLYSGVRYMSRVNPRWECWAIFDGTEVDEVSQRAIPLQDPPLQRVAKMWDLTIF